jgi:hypothetical protein
MSLHPYSSAIGGEIINHPQFDSTMIAHNLETPRVNDIFQDVIEDEQNRDEEI